MDNTFHSEQPVDDSNPSLLLRILFVLIVLGAVIAYLVFEKLGQFEAMGAQQSQTPPATSVTAATATADKWSRRIPAIGTLVASQSVDITSEIAGTIKKLHFVSGTNAKKGNLLIEVEDSSEQANLKAAIAQFNADQTQYNRLNKLSGESFVTENDLETQASQVDISRAQVVVAETALAKKQIVAPFSGRLGIRQADEGEYVSPGSVIVSLQSINRLYLDFNLPERFFKDLKKNQSIEFSVNNHPGKSFKASVKAWDPSLDSDTRNISVRAEVQNKKLLLAPGMFAEMDIKSPEILEIARIPETAIFYNIYGEAVYILENISEDENSPDYQLAARQVKVAFRENGFVGIREGLKADEKVVTSGQLKLYPGLRVAIVPDVGAESSDGNS